MFKIIFSKQGKAVNLVGVQKGDVDDGGDDGDDGDDDGDDDCMFECRWMVICQGLVVLCVCALTSNSLLAPYYVRIPGIWHAKKPSIYKYKYTYISKNKHKYKYNDKQSSHPKHTQHHMAFFL